jgi:hypothetical protein
MTASAPQAIAFADDVDVAATGLVEVVPPRGRGVGHRRGDRYADARGCGVPGATTDEYAGRAGPHQVQGSLVVGAAADNDRHVEVGDERLEVDRLSAGRDMFRRHDGPMDDEDVDAGVEDGLVVALRALWRERGRRDDTARFDLRDPLGDELLAHGGAVQLLHPLGHDRLVERGDVGQHLVDVVIASPEALGVEHGESAEPADPLGRPRRDHAVRWTGHQRQLEAPGVELPRDRDVLRVSGAPAWHDRDLVETVGAAGGATLADLELGHQRSGW